LVELFPLIDRFDPLFLAEYSASVPVIRRENIRKTVVMFEVAAKLKKGNDMAFDGRDTKICEKRDRKWLVVSEHLSLLPE